MGCFEMIVFEEFILNIIGKILGVFFIVEFFHLPMNFAEDDTQYI